MSSVVTELSTVVSETGAWRATGTKEGDSGLKFDK
jgi:hypothetical protein